jgi:hypothetical protein
LPGELEEGKCTNCQPRLLPRGQAGRLGPRIGDGVEHESLAEVRVPGRRDGTGWGLVRLGLDLVKVGLLVHMACVILGLGTVVAVWIDPPLLFGTRESWLLNLQFLLMILSFLTFLLEMLGLTLCAAAPRNAGLRGLAIACLACAGATLFFGLAWYLGPLIAEHYRIWKLRDPLRLGWVPAAGCGLACSLTFILYLHRLARYFRASTLEEACLTLLVVTSSLVVFNVLLVRALDRFDYSIEMYLLRPFGTLLILFVPLAWLWALLRHLRAIIPPPNLGND